jgi:hypothetical protein
LTLGRGNGSAGGTSVGYATRPASVLLRMRVKGFGCGPSSGESRCSVRSGMEKVPHITWLQSASTLGTPGTWGTRSGNRIAKLPCIGGWGPQCSTRIHPSLPSHSVRPPFEELELRHAGELRCSAWGREVSGCDTETWGARACVAAWAETHAIIAASHAVALIAKKLIPCDQSFFRHRQNPLIFENGSKRLRGTPPRCRETVILCSFALFCLSARTLAGETPLPSPPCIPSRTPAPLCTSRP